MSNHKKYNEQTNRQTDGWKDGPRMDSQMDGRREGLTGQIGNAEQIPMYQSANAGDTKTNKYLPKVS